MAVWCVRLFAQCKRLSQFNGSRLAHLSRSLYISPSLPHLSLSLNRGQRPLFKDIDTGLQGGRRIQRKRVGARQSVCADRSLEHGPHDHLRYKSESGRYTSEIAMK
jgi:hypothetical protein